MRKASKDMAVINRQTVKFGEAVKKKLTAITLRDCGGRALVKMRWDLNEEATRDHIFLLEINGQKAYLDLEEFMSYSRLM